MTSLLDESLAYARDEASVEPESAIDLPTLLQSLLDDQSDAGAQAGYSGPERLVFKAGPATLRRLFGNLIDNAVRYGGAVQVRVTDAADTVRVEVADPGPGIAPADRERALRPFERLEPSRSRATGGSGLGLSIARSITERLGGMLEFEQNDQEFVVVVTLPRYPGSA